MSESDVSDECEKQFNEGQELEQVINGQIYFKIYPFRSGIVQSLCKNSIINTVTITFYFLIDDFLCFGFRDTSRKENNTAWFFQSLT